MFHASKSLLVCIVCVLASFSMLQADVPQVITYQGRLTDSGGDPVVDDTYFMKFKIYGSLSGDDSLWWSGIQAVLVTDGLFTYHLGSMVPLPDDIFSTSDRYLGITIGTDSEISPRVRFVSSAYTHQALRSDTTAYAHDIADNCVTANKIANYAITELKIANNAIHSAHIQDHSITSSDIGYDEITGDNIDNGSIALEDIGQNGATDGQVIKWNSSHSEWQVAEDVGGTGDITAVHTTNGLSGGGTSGEVTVQIAPNGVTSSHIADDAVTSSDISNLTITSADIGTNAVTREKIASGAVGEDEIDTDAVDSDEIANGAVGSSEIADNTVSSSDILNYTIVDTDISNSAGIQPSKISLTAATLMGANNFSSSNEFEHNVTFNRDSYSGAKIQFYDSTMIVSNTGVRMGDAYGSYIPTNSRVLHVAKHFDYGSYCYGVVVSAKNSGNGSMKAISASAEHTTAGTTALNIYGGDFEAAGDGNARYGVSAYAGPRDTALTTGYSYGVYGQAVDGNLTYGVYGLAHRANSTNYGVYGSCGYSSGNYGVYCYGNLHSTGSNTKAGGGYKIDHPQDPANMYLIHSDVSSPEMKNVYDGVIQLDAKGEAVVELPAYFESLNDNFRYQLTCIGAYAPVYIAREIENNRFAIAGGMPFMEISWQVTGVRKDVYSKARAFEVETMKDDDDKGRYQNPELFGFDIERAVDYKNYVETEDRTE